MPSEPLARVGAARGSVCTDRQRLLCSRGPAARREGRGGPDDAGPEGEHRGLAAPCLGERDGVWTSLLVRTLRRASKLKWEVEE